MRDGGRVHVESVGAGAPLVLLHGFAMHGGLFSPVLPALAARERVHVVDLPGHGWSDAVTPFDLDSTVAAVAAATDAAAATDEPLTVLGWSLGGQIAMRWALSRPGRIARLILVATTPSFVTRDGWTPAMAPSTLGRFGDELAVAYRLTLQRFLTLQVQGSDEGRATLAALRARLFERGEPGPEALAATLAMLRANDLRPDLPRIDVPALVIGGERDALVPVEATRRLAAALPRASHLAIQGAAHAPFLSHPRAFLDAYAGFADG
ncbi:MAG: pimeloyl-ACP methyl ester esterase BioH [Candidatus Levyibacteriota bacterium]